MAAAAGWTDRISLPLLAGLALMSFVVHGGNHVLRGEPHDLMWFCNLSPLLLAMGCALRRPLAVTIPLLWLMYGTPMWLLDLFTGANVIWTSFLPHFLCIAVGLLAARKLTWPKRSWLWASLGSLLVLGLTRLITPAEHNVNLVFSVWQGWEQYFPQHSVYLAALVGLSALEFLLVETIWFRVVKGAPAPATVSVDLAH